MQMKRILTYIILLVSVVTVNAQFPAKTDIRTAGQNTVIRINGAQQNDWIKGDSDGTTNPNIQISGNENVSFYSTSEGIFVTILNGSNKIKLFALTGQLLYGGEMTQGRFLILTRRGIYFLKINNKSYKVICK